jgi:transcriptional regulator with XRE-family HTH domain
MFGQTTATMEDVFLIGKKLRHLREERKYTQEGVAIDLGVASSTYSDYERGVINVPSAVVVKASELYKVDLSYFYSLRGPVSITMNDQASNGYVEQQNSLPPEVMERLMARYETMNDKLMVLLEKFASKK